MLSGLGRTRYVVVTGDTLEARGSGGEGQASTSICQLVKRRLGKKIWSVWTRGMVEPQGEAGRLQDRNAKGIGREFEKIKEEFVCLSALS